MSKTVQCGVVAQPSSERAPQIGSRTSLTWCKYSPMTCYSVPFIMLPFRYCGNMSSSLSAKCHPERKVAGVKCFPDESVHHTFSNLLAPVSLLIPFEVIIVPHSYWENFWMLLGCYWPNRSLAWTYLNFIGIDLLAVIYCVIKHELFKVKIDQLCP